MKFKDLRKGIVILHKENDAGVHPYQIISIDKNEVSMKSLLYFYEFTIKGNIEELLYKSRPVKGKTALNELNSLLDNREIELAIKIDEARSYLKRLEEDFTFFANNRFIHKKTN